LRAGPVQLVGCVERGVVDPDPLFVGRPEDKPDVEDRQVRLEGNAVEHVVHEARHVFHEAFPLRSEVPVAHEGDVDAILRRPRHYQRNDLHVVVIVGVPRRKAGFQYADDAGFAVFGQVGAHGPVGRTKHLHDFLRTICVVQFRRFKSRVAPLLRTRQPVLDAGFLRQDLAAAAAGLEVLGGIHGCLGPALTC
jgi:hypothetical protein